MCVGEFEGLLQQQDILGGNKWLRQLDTKNSVGFKLKKKLLLLLLFFFLEKNENSLLLLFGFDSAAPASFFLSFSVKTGAMNVLPGMSRRNRCNMPDSVTITNASAGDSLQ